MVKRFTSASARTLATASIVAMLAGAASAQTQPIQVAFLWHMHQPIYGPYDSVVTTQNSGMFGFSIYDVFAQRVGPYTGWPRDAVQKGLGLPNLGTQVSFSGSLIENLNNLRNIGFNGGVFNNWNGPYNQARGWLTNRGNTRMDMVGFGYHHPLMPLLDTRDIRLQIQLHKYVYGLTFPGGSYSKGIFPPENAFATRIVPALVAEGIEWAMVDNIHFDRACQNYPYTPSSNLKPPNRADQVNPDPAASGGAWVQLNNLWAPSRVSAPFGYQPAYVQYVDPNTGAATRMIAVPAARYEGNEDGRGGYGAFLYQTVMDQYRQYNTNAARPMIVLLHHDGDNYGGGSDAYYGSNFQNMVNWATGNPNYNVTTVQDYLSRFPVPQAALIHVEPGSWAGADNGDPEFAKWLGAPNAQGVSPDINSWAVMTAAKNRVYTADQLSPMTSIANVYGNTGSNTDRAWRMLLCGQASDYWYWDGVQPWDSNVTRACNTAVGFADQVINSFPASADTTAPTVFVPQRTPYNPGGIDWGTTTQPSDFTVWTLAYDVSGLQSVTLKWRADADGVNALGNTANETYAGGAGVGAWQSVPMTAQAVPTPSANLAPTYKAQRYNAQVSGQSNVLIDYYVEAVDTRGNVQRTDIQHVFVGPTSTGGGGGGGGPVATISPDPAQAGQPVTITYNPAGRNLAGASSVFLHYGFNGWSPVISPDPVMTWNTTSQTWTITVTVPSSANQLNLVFNNGAGTWDNNGGGNWNFNVVGGIQPWRMDGTLDSRATLVAQNSAGTSKLWAGILGDVLYVASTPAGGGNDRFIFMARTPGTPVAAPWGKSGQVAQWDAFIGNENDNNWNGWFDTTATRQSASSATGVLAGTINLREEFGGTVPNEVWLATAAYPTANGTNVLASLQAPAFVTNNAVIEANEFVKFVISTPPPPAPCPGDADGNRSVGANDLSILLAAFGTSTGSPGWVASADFDNNGSIGANDLSILLANFGLTCP
ncbi:MAG: hypothetical protein IBJ11_04415 [Phycisphaerales bacterium]|nr:hypothetical protein [Phycisphaerales bacterium]